MLDEIMMEGFILYKSFYEPIKDLTNEQKGELLTAMFEYQLTGVEPKQEMSCYVHWLFFKNQFRLDKQKYENRCEKNKNNINKRWYPAGNQQESYDRYERIRPIRPNTNDTTDTNKNKNKNIKILLKNKMKVFIEENLQEENLRKKYFEFIAYRKNKNKKISFAAAEKHIPFLLGLSTEEAIASIEQSIFNDWQGLFPPKKNKNQKPAENIDAIDHSK